MMQSATFLGLEAEYTDDLAVVSLKKPLID